MSRLFSENHVILASAVLLQYTRLTDDRQTDGQHDMTIAELHNAIARFGLKSQRLNDRNCIFTPFNVSNITDTYVEYIIWFTHVTSNGMQPLCRLCQYWQRDCLIMLPGATHVGENWAVTWIQRRKGQSRYVVHTRRRDYPVSKKWRQRCFTSTSSAVAGVYLLMDSSIYCR